MKPILYYERYVLLEVDQKRALPLTSSTDFNWEMFLHTYVIIIGLCTCFLYTYISFVLFIVFCSCEYEGCVQYVVVRESSHGKKKN